MFKFQTLLIRVPRIPANFDAIFNQIFGAVNDDVQWKYIILIDLFHNNFSSSGEQPRHRKLAHKL